MTMLRRILAGVFYALLPLVTAGCLLFVGAIGCKANGVGLDPALQLLERGKAKGRLSYSSGGSLLSAGMKQVFFLGPENVEVDFSGEIDFAAPLERQDE